MSEKISIVRRLRLEANALSEFQAYASRDYGRMLLDAADEIERLRADKEKCHDIMETQSHEIRRLVRNTGCARNWWSTQFCAEAMDAHREVERLRKALAEIAENRDEPYAADHARDALKGKA